jgi:hypothetical protein
MYGMGNSRNRIVPVNDLAIWIEQHLLRELMTAVFDMTDPTLAPEAGACPDCPQRTGRQILPAPRPSHRSCR